MSRAAQWFGICGAGICSALRLRAALDLLVPLTLLALAVGPTFGCDRNTEPYVAEEPAEPDLARIFPAPQNKAIPGGGAPAQPNPQGGRGAAPVASGSAPGVPAGGSASQQTGPGIEGTIVLAEGASPRPGAILFVIARPGLATGGPPLAVVRIAEPEFPLEFAIGPENVMIPSMRFEGEIGISARLDHDGNVMSRDPSDLGGRSPGTFAPGASGVEIVLAPASP